MSLLGNSPAVGAEDKNGWSYTSSPATFLHGLSKNSFTYSLVVPWEKTSGRLVLSCGRFGAACCTNLLLLSCTKNIFWKADNYQSTRSTMAPWEWHVRHKCLTVYMQLASPMNSNLRKPFWLNFSSLLSLLHRNITKNVYNPLHILMRYEYCCARHGLHSIPRSALVPFISPPRATQCSLFTSNLVSNSWMFTSKLWAILKHLFHARAFIPESIWRTQMKMESPYKTLNIRRACRDRTDGKLKSFRE
jgi:hypothetical protein